MIHLFYCLNPLAIVSMRRKDNNNLTKKHFDVGTPIAVECRLIMRISAHHRQRHTNLARWSSKGILPTYRHLIGSVSGKPGDLVEVDTLDVRPFPWITLHSLSQILKIGYNTAASSKSERIPVSLRPWIGSATGG